MNLLKAYLLRLITRKKNVPIDLRSIETIVVLRYDRIGDMVVSLPLIKALRAVFPRSNLAVIASKHNECIAEICSFIDSVYVKPKTLLKWIKLLSTLRRGKIDLVIDLNHAVAPHAIFTTVFINPKYVASPYKDGRWGVPGTSLELYDVMPPQHPLKYARPIAETYLDIAKELGYPINNDIMYELPRIEACSSTRQKPYILINPIGSRTGMGLNSCDIEGIAKIALNFKVTIYLSSLLTTYEVLSREFSFLDNVVVLKPTQTIIPLLPVVEEASLVITPDTSLVHIACAYQTPLIAIYTSDNALYHQWRPIGENTISIIRSKNPKNLNGYSSKELLHQASSFIIKKFNARTDVL